MMHRRALGLVLRPFFEPLPPKLQQQGRKSLEALDGLPPMDQLTLACRTVVAVLTAARPRFTESDQDQVVYNTLCDAVDQWLKREIAPLRFTIPQ